MSKQEADLIRDFNNNYEILTKRIVDGSITKEETKMLYDYFATIKGNDERASACKHMLLDLDGQGISQDSLHKFNSILIEVEKEAVTEKNKTPAGRSSEFYRNTTLAQVAMVHECKRNNVGKEIFEAFDKSPEAGKQALENFKVPPFLLEHYTKIKDFHIQNGDPYGVGTNLMFNVVNSLVVEYSKDKYPLDSRIDNTNSKTFSPKAGKIFLEYSREYSKMFPNKAFSAENAATTNKNLERYVAQILTPDELAAAKGMPPKQIIKTGQVEAPPSPSIKEQPTPEIPLTQDSAPKKSLWQKFKDVLKKVFAPKQPIPVDNPSKSQEFAPKPSAPLYKPKSLSAKEQELFGVINKKGAAVYKDSKALSPAERGLVDAINKKPDTKYKPSNTKEATKSASPTKASKTTADNVKKKLENKKVAPAITPSARPRSNAISKGSKKGLSR